MKKILLIFCLIFLLAINLNAGHFIQKFTSAVSCDDCSGDLMFAWHAENADVATGTPCGCSDGDEVGTINEGAAISGTQASDGTYSVQIPTSQDYYIFDVTTEDIFSDEEGKLVFDVYIDTWASTAEFFRADDGSTSYVVVYMCGASASDIEVCVSFYGDGWTTTLQTAGTGHIEDEWLRITYQWKTSISNADHKVEICDLTLPDTTSNCIADGPEDDNDPWTGTATNIKIGNYDTSSALLYIDNVKIYATSGL